MNYPEELREKWNEVMYYERDIIEKFLKDQYDLRYGRQRDTWHFEPAVKMLSHYGNVEHVTDIMLDKDRFVIFILDDAREYECFDFAYGELSKVIETLPDASEINKKNAINDLKAITRNYNTIALLQEYPFEFNGQRIRDIEDMGEEGIKFVLDTKNFTLDTTPAVSLRDHLNIEILHHSNEYKELMELLSLEENMSFECHNYGDATFVIDGTDITFDVSSVRRNDKGCLVIYGGDIDADVCDGITLTEKEIKPQYLMSIIKCMKPKYTDIMDTYNSHNPELVRKINTAWKSGKYNQEFGYIIYSIANRDYNECKEKFDCDMDNFLSSIIDDCNESSIHNVLENVCDDWDLETILSFIRYKE